MPEVKMRDSEGNAHIFKFGQLNLDAGILSDIRDRVLVVKSKLQEVDLLFSRLVTMLSAYMPEEEMQRLMQMVGVAEDREGTLVTCLLAWCNEQEVGAAGGRQ